MSKANPKHETMTVKFTKKQTKKIRQSMVDSEINPEDAAKYLTRLADLSELRATEITMYE